jgi:uncharacterized protein YjiS (DUF1127 family)
MSRIYFATVIAVFVTTFIATNVLVVGMRGPFAPGLAAALRITSRRTSRRLKHLLDGWVAAMLARREHRAVAGALGHMSDHHLKDIGLYRDGLGTLMTDRRHDAASIPRTNHGRWK